MILYPGQWIKVKIKDSLYYGIIAEIDKPRVDVMVRFSDDNHLKRMSVQIKDVMEIDC